MKIDTFNRAFVSFVDLNNVLGSKIIKLDLFIMRTRSNAISQRMKLDLMNNSCMFLVGLDGFFCVQVPNMDQFVITRHYVGGSWGELAISYPIVVLL
jgi:hypothetical protein